MQTKVTVKNLKETKKFAKKFANSLNGGEIVLLFGEMGSGKTTFVKEVINFLGYKGIVTSPTFTIMQQYKVKKYDIYHFDMYRIENEREGRNFGMENYLYDREVNSIVFIEWPERIKRLLKGNFRVVNITKINENSREFAISYERL